MVSVRLADIYRSLSVDAVEYLLRHVLLLPPVSTVSILYVAFCLPVVGVIPKVSHVLGIYPTFRKARVISLIPRLGFLVKLRLNALDVLHNGGTEFIECGIVGLLPIFGAERARGLAVDAHLRNLSIIGVGHPKVTRIVRNGRLAYEHPSLVVCGVLCLLCIVEGGLNLLVLQYLPSLARPSVCHTCADIVEQVSAMRGFQLVGSPIRGGLVPRFRSIIIVPSLNLPVELMGEVGYLRIVLIDEGVECGVIRVLGSLRPIGGRCGLARSLRSHAYHNVSVLALYPQILSVIRGSGKSSRCEHPSLALSQCLSVNGGLVFQLHPRSTRPSGCHVRIVVVPYIACVLGIVGSSPLVLRVVGLIPSLHLAVKLVVEVFLVLGIGVVHKVVELSLYVR